MIIVKNGLRGKSASEKVKLGGNISTKMRENPNFEDAEELLDELDSATEALLKANARGKAKAIKVKVKLFNVAVMAIALYLQARVIGLPDNLGIQLIHAAGFEAKRKGSIHIAVLAAKKGDSPQSAVLRRKVPEKNKNYAYIWQVTTNILDENSWSYIKFSTVATVDIPNLVAGTRYWFRVAVVQGQDMSEYTDAVSFIAQ